MTNARLGSSRSIGSTAKPMDSLSWWFSRLLHRLTDRKNAPRLVTAERPRAAQDVFLQRPPIPCLRCAGCTPNAMIFASVKTFPSRFELVVRLPAPPADRPNMVTAERPRTIGCRRSCGPISQTTYMRNPTTRPLCRAATKWRWNRAKNGANASFACRPSGLSHDDLHQLLPARVTRLQLFDRTAKWHQTLCALTLAIAGELLLP